MGLKYLISADEDTLLKFGDIMAENLNKVKKLPRPENTWWKDASWTTSNWQTVSGWIKNESDQLWDEGEITEPQGSHPELGGVKWEVEQAAEKLELIPEELEWEIRTYAERNHMAHLGIEEDARVGNFSEIARILGSMWEKVKLSETLSPKAKSHYEKALLRYEKEFFLSISYYNFFRQDGPPSFLVNKAMLPRWTARINHENQLLAEAEQRERQRGRTMWGRALR